MTSTIKKKFVIKHVFKDVMRLANDDCHWVQPEIHYGVSWQLGVYFSLASCSYVYLKCANEADDWSIDTNVKLKINKDDGLVDSFQFKKCFSNNSDNDLYQNQFLTHILNEFDVVGNVTVEWHVKIHSINGIVGENEIKGTVYEKGFEKIKMIRFDETMEEFSDVVLVVKEQKFYMNKKFLAFHSSYFKSMFLGKFNESEKTDVELKDIDPEDFQLFLEFIHGGSDIDDKIVERLLHLADFFDAKVVFQRCEEFLLNKSQKCLSDKFTLAIRYNIDKLVKNCVSEIKSPNDIHFMTSAISSQVEESIWKVLLMKALEFT